MLPFVTVRQLTMLQLLESCWGQQTYECGGAFSAYMLRLILWLLRVVVPLKVEGSHLELVCLYWQLWT